MIVESPAKAKTIAGYLGSDYLVESSIGHIRDLPNNASEIPAKLKGESWARLGVNVDNDFEPLYVVDSRKKKVVSDLKAKLKDADELLLATDEDREGEAIAWHLREVLDPKVPVRRMVFHEITRPAIERALGETREIDERLVDAQETRRILDRLYGYEVSPVLWRKIMQGLSAGRVQSVATRLVVERERERMKFVAADYWDIVATYEPGGFTARLTSVDGRRVAQGRDFAQDGKLRHADAVQLDRGRGPRARGRPRRRGLHGRVGRGEAVHPPSRRAVHDLDAAAGGEPQAAALVAADDACRAAPVRERLHHLHAHRLDDAVRVGARRRPRPGARAVRRRLGAGAAAPVQPQGEERAGGARGDPARRRPLPHAGPGARASFRRDEFNVYDLIWKRTVASQMEDARGQTVSVRIAATAADGRGTEFSTAGTVITFRGFLLAYEEGRDEPSGDAEEKVLPPLAEGDVLNATALEPDGHSTSPPPRFTEASLVKALEERGIGRPSTYAAIMGTILDRGYVRKQGQALVPEFLAFAVVKLLEKHFPQLVDYEFTARMEDDLDEIAAGRRGAHRRGCSASTSATDGDAGLKELVEGRLAEIDAREINTVELPGSDIVVRVGKYGPYLERGTDRQTLPPDIAPDELTAARAEEILAQGNQEHELGARPRERPHDRGARRAVRPLCHRGRRRRREAAHRVALQDDVAGDGDARGSSEAADAAPVARGVRTARRCSPRTAATART